MPNVPSEKRYTDKAEIASLLIIFDWNLIFSNVMNMLDAKNIVIGQVYALISGMIPRCCV